MIDDKQTCDVCGEEFNEERPHLQHPSHTKMTEPIACDVCKPKGLDESKQGSAKPQSGVS